MKILKVKSVFLTVIALMIVGCVHLPIIINEEEKPSIHAIAELTLLLEEVSRSWEYEKYIFDCSNMSAFLYDYLSKKGYKCKIMMGWKPLWRWHVWLVAEKDGKKFWIESIGRKVACTHNFEWYFVFYSGSLETIKEIFNSIGFSYEWKY